MSKDATRDQLIDAAEHVFARDGFEGASLREIMRDAGANPAAVHYHFSGKDGLLEAVLDRAVGPITERRLECLAAIRADDDAPEAIPVRELTEVFLRPDFEAIETLRARGPGRAALIGRAYGQPSAVVRELMYRQFDPVGEAFFPEFARSLPHLDQPTMVWRLRWCMVGVIIAMFSNAEEPDGPLEGGLEVALAGAVDFVVAGLSAPVVGLDIGEG